MSDRDPGLAPERTQLAWRRTGLSFVVAALTVFRAFSGCTQPFACGAVPERVTEVSVVVVVAAALFVEAARRKPSLPADDGDEARSTVRLADLVPATVSNALLALAAIAVVLTVP